MENQVYDVNGKFIVLGDKIGSGVEANVFMLDNNNVAKIYKEVGASINQELKLNLIIKKDLNFEGICFPKYLLYNNKGKCVGYAMSKANVKNEMDLQRVLNPNSLKSKFPNWTRINLINLCETILIKVRYLHENNILLGDYNPKNFLINSDTQIYFVDTDSYQVDNLTIILPKIRSKN